VSFFIFICDAIPYMAAGAWPPLFNHPRNFPFVVPFIHTSLPFGDGAGSEVNPLPVAIPYQGDPSVEVIRALYAQNPRNEDLRFIVETIDARQQAGA
jgi:hypothetical protein